MLADSVYFRCTTTKRGGYMDELVYPGERTLSGITLIVGLILWIVLIVGTFGVALIFLLLGFIAYLFAHSALIAHIRGNGVELSEGQLPELYAQFSQCCDRLRMETRPRAYVMNGNGTLNAFATKFLGSPYVVLLSSVVDAMAENPDGVRFYMGHELGHLRMRHMSGRIWRWPALWIPLLGPAYSRAKESTLRSPRRWPAAQVPFNSARALAALSAGARSWKDVDVDTYVRQAHEPPGFWMSFHELISAYPWLSKRFARVTQPNAPLAARNGFAYIPALFVPFVGPMGGFSFLILVYVIGVLAAIAIPAYQAYTIRAKMEIIATETPPARSALARAYESTHKIPQTLGEIGVDPALADGSHLSLNPKGMLLTAENSFGQQLVFVPHADGAGHITWVCVNGEKLKPEMVPPSCRKK